jgi:ABC-type transport system involved in cytochrome bd biosynthesis fused ATPase/permease subunit
MLFDDILSPLDPKTASFLVKETLLKALKNKTILMVTHAIQYINKGDYIYIMEHGSILEEGCYDDIKEGDLIKKFKELEDVNNFSNISGEKS